MTDYHKQKYDGNLILEIAPEAVLIPVSTIVSSLVLLVDSTWTRSIGLAIIIILTIIVIWFFRSPPVDTRLYQDLAPTDIASPSYGVIHSIDKIPMDQVLQDYGPLISTRSSRPTEIGEPFAWRIVTLLNVFDVHVQCAPVSGSIMRHIYQPGTFHPVGFTEKSAYNERNITEFSTAGGNIYVVLIAGMLARKISIFPEYERPGEKINRGDKYAIIKFGSRVDTIIPSNYQVLVHPGETVVGGETLLATL